MHRYNPRVSRTVVAFAVAKPDKIPDCKFHRLSPPFGLEKRNLQRRKFLQRTYYSVYFSRIPHSFQS